MKLASLALAVILTSCYMDIADAGYRRVCYYTNWSKLRPGVGQFLPSDIDASLCTHIIFAFAHIKSHKLHKYYKNDTELYSEVTSLKLQNPDLKVLLAVGWANFGRKAFSRLVSVSSRIQTFADSAVSFLRQHDFDGLDLNWEYPAVGTGSHPDEKEKFGELCMTLRQVFENESVSTGNDRLLLTSAVSPLKSIIDVAYNASVLAANLDFVSIMTYDMHNSNTENHTDHHSLLIARSGAVGDDKYLSMTWAADYWQKLGVAGHQINIGLATYGRGFTLTNTTLSGIEAYADGPSNAGPYTEAEGLLAYYEVCDMMATGGQSYRNYGSPYFVHADQWIGYDDEESIHWKIVWLVKEDLGGAMIFSFDLDDFRGSCNSSMGTFPLIRAVKDKLLAAENGTLPLPTNFYCGGKPNGLYAYEGNCMGFGMCNDGKENWIDCPNELMFDKDMLTCVSKDIVNCLV
ncbi:chitinase-3-like protein 1 [Pecten maximus]|uniref:chitinase-3-like protein 1 n=1 Tax=Pecten maximus TaxID=6579 RepID=UPI0014580258|nr:chitinase-3-like protein 1 [Pecten maximus]